MSTAATPMQINQLFMSSDIIIIVVLSRQHSIIRSILKPYFEWQIYLHRLDKIPPQKIFCWPWTTQQGPLASMSSTTFGNIMERGPPRWPCIPFSLFLSLFGNKSLQQERELYFTIISQASQSQPSLKIWIPFFLNRFPSNQLTRFFFVQSDGLSL